jgi:hypothetical protein
MNCTKSQSRFGVAIEFAESGNSPTTISDAHPRLKSKDKEQMAIAVCRNLRDVLGELQGLLEQYSPAWYTQRHYEQARIALQQFNGL